VRPRHRHVGLLAALVPACVSVAALPGSENAVTAPVVSAAPIPSAQIAPTGYFAAYTLRGDGDGNLTFAIDPMRTTGEVLALPPLDELRAILAGGSNAGTAPEARPAAAMH
jgi:hypothetical protein